MTIDITETTFEQTIEKIRSTSGSSFNWIPSPGTLRSRALVRMGLVA